MVVNAGGYYGLAFRRFRGMMQGDPLSPTIFNVVVDAVARHWVEVMVESAENQSGRGQEGRQQNDLFYEYGGMVTSLDTRWIQGALSTLVGMLDRVGLKKNIGKIFGMVYHLC